MWQINFVADMKKAGAARGSGLNANSRQRE
jgi:hypothetical protein